MCSSDLGEKGGVHVVNVVGWKALPVGSSHHGHLSRLWRLNFLGNQRDSLHPPFVAMHNSNSCISFAHQE